MSVNGFRTLLQNEGREGGTNINASQFYLAAMHLIFKIASTRYWPNCGTEAAAILRASADHTPGMPSHV